MLYVIHSTSFACQTSKCYIYHQGAIKAGGTYINVRPKYAFLCVRPKYVTWCSYDLLAPRMTKVAFVRYGVFYIPHILSIPHRKGLKWGNTPLLVQSLSIYVYIYIYIYYI